MQRKLNYQGYSMVTIFKLSKINICHATAYEKNYINSYSMGNIVVTC